MNQKRFLSLLLGLLILTTSFFGCRRSNFPTGENESKTEAVESDGLPLAGDLNSLAEILEETGILEKTQADDTSDSIAYQSSENMMDSSAQTVSQSSVNAVASQENSTVSSEVVSTKNSSPTSLPLDSEPVVSEQAQIPHIPVSGRLVSMLSADSKYSLLLNYIGMGFEGKHGIVVEQWDYNYPIIYAAKTGTDQFYCVYRPEDGGLLYAFFNRAKSPQTLGGFVDGEWKPFEHYLVRKHSDRNEEFGQWIDGQWVPWEKDIPQDVLQLINEGPDFCPIPLIDGELYLGSYEIREGECVQLTHIAYVSEIHSYTDFAGLSSENTLDDVYAIDPAIQRKWAKHTQFTLHMLTDGMLVIRYVYDQEHNEFFVSKLYYYPDYVVDGSVVVYGEERGGPLYDFSILPEDRFWE